MFLRNIAGEQRKQCQGEPGVWQSKESLPLPRPPHQSLVEMSERENIETRACLSSILLKNKIYWVVLLGLNSFSSKDMLEKGGPPGVYCTLTMCETLG